MDRTFIATATAEIRLFSTTLGGRTTPIADGYRPHLRLGSHDGFAQVALGIDRTLAPGEVAAVALTLVGSAPFISRLEAGAKFSMHEGARIVGEGKILDIERAQEAPLLRRHVRISVSDPWEFQFHHPSVLYGEIVDGKQTDTSRPILTVKLDQPLTTENSAFPNVFASPRHQGKDLAELAAGENVPFNFSTVTDGDVRLAGETELAFVGAMQMAEYAKEDLTIISDAIAHVRRNPARYLGNLPVSGEVIAARLASDIIQSNHLPLTVYRNDDWWVVAAGTDWIGHEAVEHVFSSISSTPELGTNSARAEILVTSFARSAFTCDSSGMRWITGDDVMPPRDLRTAVGGRLVCFRMDAP